MDSNCEKADSTEVEDLCNNFIKNMEKLEFKCFNNEKQEATSPKFNCQSPPNFKNLEENTLMLINSKRILIDLVDKEIKKISNKNETGDSNKNYETEKLKKQQRLINIANIRNEIETLEKSFFNKK